MNESMRYGKQQKVINQWKNTNWDDAKQQQQSRDTLINNWQHSARSNLTKPIQVLVSCLFTILFGADHTNTLACSIFCDSYEITWFWQPESTLHRHWKFRFCTDIWPAVFILYTFRFNYRSKKHRGLGGSVFRDGVLYSCIWLVESAGRVFSTNHKAIQNKTINAIQK